MLSKRILTALIGLPLFLLLIFRGPPFLFFLAVLIVALLGQKEFYLLFEKENLRLQQLLGLFLGALVLQGFYSQDFSLMVQGLVVSVLSVLVFRTFSHQNVDRAAGEIAITLMGILYVAFFMGFLILLRGEENGRAWILFLFAVVWAGDTGAFYSGRSFGKRKLYQKISPNKTIEGAVGGLISSLTAALLLWYFLFAPEYRLFQILVLGLVLGVSGQIGDLAESLLKRASGAKDSGSIFPGHGGVLDRFDSILFASPVLYYLVA